MAYELLIGTDSFEQVRRDWQALELSGPSHVFQTYDFAAAWLRTAGVASRAVPLIVRHQRDGRTVGLFPACTVRYKSLRLTTWMAGPFVIDFGDILFDGEAADTDVHEFVAQSLTMLRSHSRVAPLYLTNVRDDALAHAPLSGLARVHKTSAAPFVDTSSGDFDAYRCTLTKNTRHNVQRKLHHLEQHGPVTLRLLDAHDQQTEALARRLLKLKLERFSQLGPASGVFSPGYVDFRTEQVRAEPHTRIAAMFAGERLVACQIVCVYRKRMYLLVSAFESEFSECSPGQLLDYLCIKECFESDIDVCDFGWGTETHKYQWTALETGLTTFVADDLGGRLLSAAARIRHNATERRTARHATSSRDSRA